MQHIVLTRQSNRREAERCPFLQTDRNEIMDQEPCTPMVITLCTMAFEKQFMLVFIVGSLCGFLLVSLCIWLLFGNELVDILLKPRPKEYRITKYFNYLGNQIIHIITTLFEKLGKVLELPAQQVQIDKKYDDWEQDKNYELVLQPIWGKQNSIILISQSGLQETLGMPK
nr:unnamed protein product [Callosobruchus analis]